MKLSADFFKTDFAKTQISAYGRLQRVNNLIRGWLFSWVAYLRHIHMSYPGFDPRDGKDLSVTNNNAVWTEQNKWAQKIEWLRRSEVRDRWEVFYISCGNTTTGRWGLRPKSCFPWKTPKCNIRIRKGCCHSLVYLSVPTIWEPRVRVPSTPSSLSFILKFVLYLSCEKTKINNKRPGLAHF